ncbi:MAG: AraC family ligand binding domain-containing protein, partial [Planctomycetota bacterium]
MLVDLPRGRWQAPPGSSWDRLGLDIQDVGRAARPWQERYRDVRWLGRRYGLILCCEGGGYFENDRCDRQTVQPGDVCLLFPGIWHGYGPTRHTVWGEAWCLFDGPAARALWRNAPLSPLRPVVHPPDQAGLERSMRRLQQAVRQDRAAALPAALVDLLVRCVQGCVPMG